MGIIQRDSLSLDSIAGLVEDALEGLVMDSLSNRQEMPAMSIAKEVLLSGGKRYRPIVGLISYKAAGGNDLSEVMNLALSAELIHTATLIHDDVYDRSMMRRGKPTIQSSHGIAHAIIAGDYLFSLGFKLGAGYSPEIVKRVGEACAGVASGELMQFKHVRNLNTKPEDYYAIVDGKTAGAFACGCSCSAINADSDEEIVDGLWGYGIELGRAFQLVDDLLDLVGDDSIGKPRGTDVHEGKMTLPLIYALTMLHGEDRKQLEDTITNFSDFRLQELQALLEKAGSFDYARLLISNHVERAIDSLEKIPESNAKDLLIDLAELSMSRTN